MERSEWNSLFEPRNNRTIVGTARSGVATHGPSGEIYAVALFFLERELPAGTKGGSKGKAAKVGRLPRKNAYFQAVKAGQRASIAKTSHARAFIAALEEKARKVGLDVRPTRHGPTKGDAAKAYRAERPIRDGWWELDLLVVSKRRNLSLDVLTPATDSDSCLSPVKDALQHAGILDDDARITGDRTLEAIGAEDAIGIRLRRASPIAVSRVWGVDFFGPSD